MMIIVFGVFNGLALLSLWMFFTRRERRGLTQQKINYDDSFARSAVLISDLIYIQLEKIVNTRKNAGYELGIKRGPHHVSSSVGGTVQNSHYDLFEIFSPERAYEGLSRDLYVAVFPYEHTISLVVDGKQVITKGSMPDVLGKVFMNVEKKVETMGMCAVRTSA